MQQKGGKKRLGGKSTREGLSKTAKGAGERQLKRRKVVNGYQINEMNNVIVEGTLKLEVRRKKALGTG